MATVRYTVLDGEIVAEDRAGTERDYVPDPLGSTVALLDSSQAKTDTFSYWPYGEGRTRSGMTATQFQFAGMLGYYHDDPTRLYVRARVIGPRQARWISQDPARRELNGYSYVIGRAVTFVDPSGLAPPRRNNPNPPVWPPPGTGVPKPPPGPGCWYASCGNPNDIHRFICSWPPPAGRPYCEGFYPVGDIFGSPSIISSEEDVSKMHPTGWSCMWVRGDCQTINLCRWWVLQEYLGDRYNVITHSCWTFVTDFLNCVTPILVKYD
jgi:RHS repeat-associated protein